MNWKGFLFEALSRGRCIKYYAHQRMNENFWSIYERDRKTEQRAVTSFLKEQLLIMWLISGRLCTTIAYVSSASNKAWPTLISCVYRPPEQVESDGHNISCWPNMPKLDGIRDWTHLSPWSNWNFGPENVSLPNISNKNPKTKSIPISLLNHLSNLILYKLYINIYVRIFLYIKETRN